MIRKAKEDHYNNNTNNSSGKTKAFFLKKVDGSEKNNPNRIRQGSAGGQRLCWNI